MPARNCFILLKIKNAFEMAAVKMIKGMVSNVPQLGAKSDLFSTGLWRKQKSRINHFSDVTGLHKSFSFYSACSPGIGVRRPGKNCCHFYVVRFQLIAKVH